jgi:hypothetical protein
MQGDFSVIRTFPTVIMTVCCRTIGLAGRTGSQPVVVDSVLITLLLKLDRQKNTQYLRFSITRFLKQQM